MTNYRANKNKSLFRQRLIGLGFLILSVTFIFIAIYSKVPSEEDISVILLLIPMGIYALLTSG